MIDKPIIIDGVDVSGCCQYMPRHMEDYDIDTLDYCMHYFKPCKNVDVKYCYYKQLMCKERECQQAMDNYVQLDLQRVKEYNELVDLYKAKEQEREELKEENFAFEQLIKEYEKYGAIEEIIQQLNQLKKTLAEIKEIAEKAMREGSMISGGWLYQKISEVIQDEN